MIQTDRLVLRPAVDADRDAIAAMNGDTRVSDWLGGPIDRAASDAFVDGLAHFRAARFEAAASEFETATAHAPTAAKYAYFHAIALYQLDRTTEAEQRLAEAVQLEAEHPVADWGRAMERVQGRARLWVEAARQSP